MSFQQGKSPLDLTAKMSAIIFVAFSLFASAGFAQSEGAAPAAAAKKEKKTTLNFEDEMVQGETSKPELFYLFQKKNFNYKRLIRLRENFIPEMKKTSEDIPRSKGGN